MTYLAITPSSGDTQYYPLELTEGSEIRIGRDAGCDISLPDASFLSRVHCIISRTNGQLIIRDNNSSNGIFSSADGHKVDTEFLEQNTEYRMGDCMLMLQERDDMVQPQAYPQAEAYPQPQAYPQAEAYPQPQAYPQAQAYPQPQAYPQAQAYPQPQAYPQAEAYPQPQAYPQAQAYPQPQAYPQAQAYPQPQAYP
ncbi:MAG: FHA domain-containing protein, partial [Akkermansiaceae bacterium]|nr:FHA domain-containing protein [Akkermansiaceae bacterium]